MWVSHLQTSALSCMKQGGLSGGRLFRSKGLGCIPWHTYHAGCCQDAADLILLQFCVLHYIC